MARKPVVLVTGAGGEIGHGLIHRLADLGSFDVLAVDAGRSIPSRAALRHGRVGDILDRHLLERLHGRVRDLRRLPPRRAPVDAGGVRPRDRPRGQRAGHAEPARIWPSRRRARSGIRSSSSSRARSRSTGLPDLRSKRAAGKVAEDAWLTPITMYGCNKLLLRAPRPLLRASLPAARARERAGGVDFRAIRFPA